MDTSSAKSAMMMLLSLTDGLPQAHAATVVHDVLHTRVWVRHHVGADDLAVIGVHVCHAVMGNQVSVSDGSETS